MGSKKKKAPSESHADTNTKLENQDELDEKSELSADNSEDTSVETSGETSGKNSTLDELLEEVFSEEADTAEDSGDDKKAAPKKKRFDAATLRKLRYGGISAAITAGAVALIILINVISGVLYSKFPVMFDMTSDNKYTLSDASKDILKDVESPVEIIIFSDEELFTGNFDFGVPEINDVFKQFYELLKQYRLLSGEKVSYQFVNLDVNPTLASKYPNNSPGEILFRSTLKRANGTEVLRENTFTFDDLMTYENNPYTGETVVTSSEAERVSAAALLKVISTETPTIMMLTGFQEDTYVIEGIKQMLKTSNYNIISHDISSPQDFPEEAVMAIIPAPKNDYDAASLERLESWMYNGGARNHDLVVIPNMETPCPALYQKIKVDYDIEITDRFIWETSASRMFGYGAQLYPYYTNGDIASDALTGTVAGKLALMPYCLQLVTTRVSGEENAPTGLDIVSFPDSADVVSMDALTVAAEGGELETTPVDSYLATGMAYINNYGYGENNEQWNTNVLVCGSAGFFYQQIFQNYANGENNETLFVGLLNEFTGNEVTTQVRSYSFNPSILEFSPSQAIAFTVICVVLLPLALIATAIIVFIRRRRL